MPEDMFDRDPRKRIGKQIVLPFSRAVEISIKSLKIRFWRSLITVSSIVLAIAFLSYILVNTSVLRALKDGPESVVSVLEAEVKTFESRLGEGAADSQKLAAQKTELARERMLRDQIRLSLRTEGGAEGNEPAGAKRGFFADFKAKDYWLTSLALLVCFVGIVNAMLMSVTERFREIGTMKCLGALDSFIVKLFVLESVFQGSIGTFMGIITGTLLAVVRIWARYGTVTFRFFPWLTILACMAIAQGVGTLLTVVAAVFPARAAARMQPVDALRIDQ